MELISCAAYAVGEEEYIPLHPRHRLRWVLESCSGARHGSIDFTMEVIVFSSTRNRLKDKVETEELPPHFTTMSPLSVTRCRASAFFDYSLD